MARPTKPKDLKPKEADIAPVPGGGPAPAAGPALDIKLIAIIVVMSLVSVLGSVGGMYGLWEFVIKNQVAQSAPAHGEEGEAGAHGEGGEEAHAPVVGMNLELDEFTVNLKTDPTEGGEQFLRTKMALSIQVPPTEDCYAVKHASLPSDGTIAGAAAPVVDRETLASGGGGGPSCEDVFKGNMGKFVPTVRDIINGALMKRTAGTLATLEGQEALKDEIKEEVNAIMAPNYQVIRVNFQEFIIDR